MLSPPETFYELIKIDRNRFRIAIGYFAIIGIFYNHIIAIIYP